MADSLKRLLARARDADPLTRIELRDPIAANGAAAVEAMTSWLADPTLGAFAVRVIEKAAANGARRDAIAALTGGRSSAASDAVRRDIDIALEHLQPRPARPPGDPYTVDSIPPSAGLEWPGFQPEEFHTLAGTSWRNRDGRTSLAPIVTVALRQAHPHFESYAVERCPELHFAIRDRHRQGSDHAQGVRAGKLVVYAHGPRADHRRDQPEQVAAGLYFEKGDGAGGFGPVDDTWDWPWLLRALETEHVRDELAQVMAAHDLSIGDYEGEGFGPESETSVGFVGEIDDGRLVMHGTDGVRGVGFDELLDRLESLPPDRRSDLHIWRTWPAAEAIAAGRSFAFDELIPVLTDLATVYLDIVGEPLERSAARG